MRVYLELARRSFQRQLAYRQAAIAGIFTNAVFGLLISSTYRALYQSRDAASSAERVAGFNVSEIYTFIWIGQSLLMVIAIWGWWEMSASIRSGDVVMDLMKPLNYFGYWLSQDLGRAGSQVLMRFIPTFLVGAMLFDLAMPSGIGRWTGFAVSITLATVVSFAFRFMLNATAFWMTEVAGVRTMALFATNFLSGLLVPLSFFPEPLRTVAELMPFQTFIMIPVKVFLGQGSIWNALGLQLFWAIVMSGLALLTLRFAVRKVVIQGG